MTTVSANDFSDRAVELLGSVESGNTIVVLRDGKAIARLEPNVASLHGGAAEDGLDDETSNDIHVYDLRPKPLTEFRFGTAAMTLRPRTIEANLAWLADGPRDIAATRPAEITPSSALSRTLIAVIRQVFHASRLAASNRPSRLNSGR